MRSRQLPSVAEFMRLRWQMLTDNPVIEPPGLSPIIADPTFLGPDETPDGRWHLFAHSVWGLHHFEAVQPNCWQPRGIVKRHAMRAFLLHDQGEYALYYERYRPYQIFFSWLTRWRWKSRIMVMRSRDLLRWSKPQLVLAPCLSWHSDSPYGASVSNPCVVATGKEYRLYYSASLRLVPDCGFCEPAHIGMATAASAAGPFIPELRPQVSADAKIPWMNLAAGAQKVLRLRDGYVALQNGIYQTEQGKSGSAIYAVPSKDGRRWLHGNARCLLAPDAAHAWRASHVYAVDCRYIKSERRWYLFFNGRNTAHWTQGREAIGAMYA